MTIQYLGLNPHTGGSVTDDDHISQSIRDILCTPKHTRVMRRSYGSSLCDLVDAPQTPSIPLRLRAGAMMALSEQETRIRVTAIRIDETKAGAAVITITSTRKDTQQSLSTTINLKGTA